MQMPVRSTPCLAPTAPLVCEEPEAALGAGVSVEAPEKKGVKELGGGGTTRVVADSGGGDADEVRIVMNEDVGEPDAMLETGGVASDGETGREGEDRDPEGAEMMGDGEAEGKGETVVDREPELLFECDDAGPEAAPEPETEADTDGDGRPTVMVVWILCGAGLATVDGTEMAEVSPGSG